MSLNSINTNAGALQGLVSLNAAAQQVTDAQRKVSTGLKVASAKDDGAIWSIAQTMRSKVADWQVVSDSLDRGQSILDVAASGAAEIGDLLKQLQAKALAFSDSSLDATSKTAIQADMAGLVEQIDRSAKNGGFNGVNLLNASASSGPSGPVNLNPPAPTSPSAGQFEQVWSPNVGNQVGTFEFTFLITGSTSFHVVYDNPDLPATHAVLVQNLGSNLLSLHTQTTNNATLEVGTYADGFGSGQLQSAIFTPDAPSAAPAATAIQISSDTSGGKTTLSGHDLSAQGLSLDNLDYTDPSAVMQAVNAALSTTLSAGQSYGMQQNQIASSQQSAIKMIDELQTGIGNLVDADMGQESANLQAAQSKQELAAKALAIANASPQFILSLFR